MMKRIFTLTLVCGMAGTLPGIAAAATDSPADLFNTAISNQEKEVVAAADAMPADKFDYAPTAGEFKGVRTFAGQVKHLTEANYYFFSSFNVPGGKTNAEIEKLTSKDQIMQAFRDSYTYMHTAVATMTAANAFESLGKDKGTRVGWTAHELEHTMDHYGQMVVYLRLNGIVPPASRKAGM